MIKLLAPGHFRKKFSFKVSDLGFFDLFKFFGIKKLDETNRYRTTPNMNNYLSEQKSK